LGSKGFLEKEDDMTGSSAVPRPPSSLAAGGRRLWREVHQNWELDPIDTALLTELCAAVDQCERIRTELKSAKLLVEGSTGQPRVTPLLGALHAQEKVVDRLACSLRLSVPGEAHGRPHQTRAVMTRWAKARGDGPRRVTSIVGA
jgi:phage terminase small subunit